MQTETIPKFLFLLLATAHRHADRLDARLNTDCRTGLRRTWRSWWSIRTGRAGRADSAHITGWALVAGCSRGSHRAISSGGPSGGARKTGESGRSWRARVTRWPWGTVGTLWTIHSHGAIRARWTGYGRWWGWGYWWRGRPWWCRRSAAHHSTRGSTGHGASRPTGIRISFVLV